MTAILLVEDDRLVSHAMNDALTSAGYQVSLARSCKEGLRLASESSFDLLLLDIGLPDGSGLDLALRLREMKHTTPFIFLTAYQEDSVVQVGIALGAYSFLVKPIRTHQLLPIVRSAFAKLTSEADKEAKLIGAINTNRVISAAAGFLAAQGKYSTDTAVEAMRQWSRLHNIKLEALAKRILAGERIDMAGSDQKCRR